MQIHVNTDRTIKSSPELRTHVESVVEGSLSRFGTRITRVEVHISDENSHKGGDNDIKCVIEARIAGMQPITVTQLAASLDQSLDGAADKIEKVIDRTLGRINDSKGRTSAAGDQSE